MPALKLSDVQARVVAWHNRHPLARRIQPSQVHSIGTVSLPFGSQHPADESPAHGHAAAPGSTAPPGHTETAGLAATTPAPLPEAPPVPDTGMLVPDDLANELAAALADDLARQQGDTNSSSDDPDAAPTDGGAARMAAELAAEMGPDAPPAEPEAPVPTALPATDALAASTAPSEPAASPALAESAADAADADDAPAAAEPDDPLPASSAVPEPGADGDPSANPDPAATAEPSAATPPANALDQAPEPAVQVDVDPQAGGPDGQGTAGSTEAAPATLAERLQAARAAAHSGEAMPASADAGLATVSPGRDSAPPPHTRQASAAAAAGPAWRRWLPPWLPKWLAAWGGPDALGGRLAPLFDSQFMWPVKPARIARWARQHASADSLARPEWRQRQLPTLPALQRDARSNGHPHALQLHAMTAAIGVGDRRLRVLLAPNGQVLGPRAWDHRRVGALLTVAGLALAGGGYLWPRHPAGAMSDTHPAEAAASAPDAGHTRHDDTAAHDGPHGQAAADAHAEAASATASASSASATAQAAGPAHAPALTDPTAPPSTAAAKPQPGASTAADAHAPATPMPHGDAPAHGAAAAGTAVAKAASAPANEPVRALAEAPPPSGQLVTTTTPPPRFPQRRASGPLVRIRPTLSDEDRALAREQSQAARAAGRGQPMANPPAGAQTAAAPAASSPAGAANPAAASGKRYAVVGPGTPQREPAEAHLAQMLAVRAQLPPPAPAETQLVFQNGRWHAALWTFASEADADKARGMLATRGLKSEIIPF